MTSSPFERQITEPGTSDRTSASTSRMSDGPQQYPPSVSFLEHDRPSVRLVELPAWLQAFAASVGEPSDNMSGAPSDKDLGDAEDLESKLAPGQSSVPAPEKSAGGSFGTNFISEDDLPEWLRAIAPIEGEDNDTELFLSGEDGSMEQLGVPNVARAWSTTMDARGLDESTSLFALVASQASPSVLPSAGSGPSGQRPRLGEQSAANAQAEATGMVASYGSELPPDMASGHAFDSSRTTGASAGDQAARLKAPMLPIVIAGVLLVVLVVVAIALFVL